MAANPVTGVDFDRDLFAVFRVSDGTFINLQAQWLRADGGPIVGGNPDLKYYKRVEGERPPVDYRFTLQQRWEAEDADPVPPEGHPAGWFRQSYTATKLERADLLIQVESAFQAQVRIAIPETDVPSMLAATLDAMNRKQDGEVLTPKQQGLKAAHKMVGLRLSQLEARKEELVAAVVAGDDYDIADWPTLV